MASKMKLFEKKPAPPPPKTATPTPVASISRQEVTPGKSIEPSKERVTKVLVAEKTFGVGQTTNIGPKSTSQNKTQPEITNLVNDGIINRAYSPQPSISSLLDANPRGQTLAARNLPLVDQVPASTGSDENNRTFSIVPSRKRRNEIKRALQILLSTVIITFAITTAFFGLLIVTIEQVRIEPLNSNQLLNVTNVCNISDTTENQNQTQQLREILFKDYRRFNRSAGSICMASGLLFLVIGLSTLAAPLLKIGQHLEKFASNTRKRFSLIYEWNLHQTKTASNTDVKTAL